MKIAGRKEQRLDNSIKLVLVTKLHKPTFRWSTNQHSGHQVCVSIVVPSRSNWLRHDRFITLWATQAMRQCFILAGGATSLIWSSPNAFRNSAKARNHLSIGFVMGTRKTLLRAARMAGWLHYLCEKRFPKTRQVGFDLVLGSNGKQFRTCSIEVVRFVKLLDEAKSWSTLELL
ncbi:uncharacterized protein LOC8054242 isoform X2 [Sorghum bicolor]|uniref:uncharacterized protein LOC8054242 isoform X2 n=1 Tax=Sorghum bicolor TaxID=4558 RepID=UPI000B426D20|nr:uncharacterized protein LOC8054242 isoform X2 [Sorghum bicolor]|eukprot:XP_021315720.1 uncharacterized protein LOC8054242 isoform X2 [Sorghum bicolor]